ncbi:hypothetical protein D3C72_1267810 [compost metagenome]
MAQAVAVQGHGKAAAVHYQGEAIGGRRAVHQTGVNLRASVGTGVERDANPAAGRAVRGRTKGRTTGAVVADDQPVAELAGLGPGLPRRRGGRDGACRRFSPGGRRRGALIALTRDQKRGGDKKGGERQQAGRRHGAVLTRRRGA